MASALSLASLVAPRFVDTRYIGASQNSLKLDAVKTAKAKHGIKTEHFKW
jgi:hypothetical protein